MIPNYQKIVSLVFGLLDHILLKGLKNNLESRMQFGQHF